jgi:hypothetical protein
LTSAWSRFNSVNAFMLVPSVDGRRVRPARTRIP